MRAFRRGTVVVAAAALILSFFATAPALARAAVPTAGSAGSVDWPFVRFDQANSGYNPAETTLSPSNVGQLKIAWSSVVHVDPRATPVLSGGSLYIACQDASGAPNECAIDAATGGLIWMTPVGAKEPATTAAVSGDILVGGQNPATMYAVNPSTGAVVWKTATSAAHFLSAPLAGDGLIFAQADDGNLYAFAIDGSKKWTVSTGRVSGTPAFISTGTYNLLYVPARTSSGGQILVLNAADGTPNCLPMGFDIVGSPAIQLATSTMIVGTPNVGGQGVANVFREPVGPCSSPNQTAGGPSASAQVNAIPTSSATGTSHYETTVQVGTAYEGFSDGSLRAFDMGPAGSRSPSARGRRSPSRSPSREPAPQC